MASNKQKRDKMHIHRGAIAHRGDNMPNYLGKLFIIEPIIKK